MDSAVTKLPIVEVGLLGSLTGQLRHTRHSLALTLALLDLGLQNVRTVLLVDMEVVVYILFDKVADIFIDGFRSGCHDGRTEFDLRLTFEDGLLHIDSNGCNKTITDVRILIFAKMLFDRASNMLLESRLVCAALRGVLAVDKGVVLLTVLVGVGKRDLDILSLHVDDRIKGLACHIV